MALAEAASGAVSIGAGSGVPAYEYRSARTLLGWPLIHICFGRPGGQPMSAKGWIACGNGATGILLAIGGAAIGGVAIGTAAIGGVAIGCCAVGGISCGGAAVGWLAAFGGAAVARYYACGGIPDAQHAVWLPHAWLYTNLLVLICCLPMVPGIVYWRRLARRK